MLACRNWGAPLRYCMDVSSSVSSLGSVVAVPIAANRTSRLLTDGNATVMDDDAGTSVNVTLNKHRYSKFSITGMGKALAGDLSARMAMNSAIAALLNGVEEDVLSLTTAGFSTCTALGTYANALTEAVCTQAVSSVRMQRPPEGDELLGLVRPDILGWGALEVLATFASADYRGAGSNVLGEQVAGNGRVWHGARWICTGSLPRNSTSSDGIVMHRSAIAVAMRVPPVPVAGASAINVTDPQSGIAFQLVLSYNGSTLADDVVAHTIYGYATAKEPFGCQLKY